jgi:CubicO group peptidase (beta-lactamase class C family)
MHPRFPFLRTWQSKPSALFLLVLLACHPAEAAAPPPLHPIDAILTESLRSWQAPGVAVAVVHNDRVVYLGGMGVREQGRSERVTPDTLFGIASCTKAFTATALALLIDEGKASWDDAVRKHVGFFRLADPLANRDVALRDLLCHRTGLSRHDLLWYRAPWSVEETVRRMAFLDPSSSFRSRYEYNNLCYIAAGLAVQSAGKMPWHEFVQKRLFVPLGMKGAVFNRQVVLRAPDHATPHRRGKAGKPEPMPWYDDDRQIRASGSIKAGVRDLSQWIRLQLAGGTVDGKRLVSAANMKEMHTPQMVIPLGPNDVGATQSSYGLGWRISDYRGHQVIQHGGATEGFRSRILLLPRDRIGIVVLTNVEESGLVTATALHIADHMLGLSRKDWYPHYRDRAKEEEAARKERLRKREASRRPGTLPSQTLESYTGKYHDLAYGTLEITLAGKELVLKWSSFTTPLQHFQHDTFVVTESKGAASQRLLGELAVFRLDPAGKVSGVRFLGRRFGR